jgi:hypothetical protein
MSNKKLPSKKQIKVSVRDYIKEISDLKQENQKLKDLIKDIFEILEKKT